MQRRVPLLAIAWLTAAPGTFVLPACADLSPWETNTPLVHVRKELYATQPQIGAGAVALQYKAGPELQRIEFTSNEFIDDQRSENRFRLSNDNGRTWSDYQTLPDDTVINVDPATGHSVRMWEGTDASIPFYDSRAGVLFQPWLQRVYGIDSDGNENGKFYDFSYYRLSTDYGATWTPPKQLKYESGPDYDPSHPLDNLSFNNAYIAENLTLTSSGKLILGIGNTKALNGSDNIGGELMGAFNFSGTWNGLTGAAADYTWQASNRVAISPTYVNSTTPVSTRGLMETSTAQLQDGRVINLWRGSNKGLSGSAAAAGGHKWFSIADSEGQSLGPIQELKYDDGTRFYSASSRAWLFRSELTNKLYWFGNVTPDVPSGNRPRETLVIAEFDETLLAVKKDTLTIIDERAPDQPSLIQFNNFSILENPENHKIELMLTDYGADGHPSQLGGNAYKYTVSFAPVPPPPTVPVTANLLVNLNGNSVSNFVSDGSLVQVWKDLEENGIEASRQDFGQSDTDRQPTLLAATAVPNTATTSIRYNLLQFDRSASANNGRSSGTDSDLLKGKDAATPRPVNYGDSFTVGPDAAYEAANAPTGVTWFVVYRSTDDTVINNNNGLQGGTSTSRWGQQAIVDAQYSDGSIPGGGKNNWGLFAADGTDADTHVNLLNHIRDIAGNEIDHPNESIDNGTSANMSVSTWYMAANSYDPVNGIFCSVVTTPDGSGGIATLVDLTTTNTALVNTHGIGDGQENLNIALGELAHAAGGNNDWSFDGLLAEVLIYNTALSTTDFDLVADYLNDKYFAASVLLAGDYNGDGTVDLADYIVWRKNPASYGGDPGGYVTWRQNFGAGRSTGSGFSAVAIPEPNTFLLVSSLVLGLTTALRKRPAISAPHM
ncbi:MAG: sialidase family protein [Pirellulales bacterium]